MEHSVIIAASNKPMSLPPSSRTTPTQEFPLTKLPPELRRMVYRFCFEDSDYESCDDQDALHDAVYRDNIQRAGAHKSLSLLRLNKQFFDVVSGVLRYLPLRITMRVTAQGIALEKIAIIPGTNRRSKDNCEMETHYMMEIWPPHLDRPVEAFYIWNHMRLFRERMKAFNSRRALLLRFIDNRSFGWAPFGRPSCDLSSLLVRDQNYDEWTRDRNDMAIIVNLFATRTSVQAAHHSLSISRPDCLYALQPRWQVCMVRGIMERSFRPPIKDQLFEEVMIEAGQADLKYRTACIALEKLRRITRLGKAKICERYFDKLATPWPFFELLQGREGGPTYEGKWFYAEPHVQGNCKRCIIELLRKTTGSL
ncbi:MAG: hypothetical protein LQ352_008208 [Teloschistes flavicans]|nr:MAG: hypothetical protein LQ352_008208 [Teloschistes flavicans]